MVNIQYVGVDGCPYGWFSVALAEEGDGYETLVCRTFRQLVHHYRDATLVLVDMPIGLPQGAPGRQCDDEARDRVGARGASVYPTPTRQTVQQIGVLPQGCLTATHLQYRFRDAQDAGVMGINLQTFAIVPKIAEIDEVMRLRVHNAQPVVREVHPEMCFLALNGGVHLQYPKTTPDGVHERLEILGMPANAIEPNAEAIYADACQRFPRSDVGRDDILDALSAVVTAHNSGGAPLTMPAIPQQDPQYPHLNMEIVYWPQLPV